MTLFGCYKGDLLLINLRINLHYVVEQSFLIRETNCGDKEFITSLIINLIYNIEGSRLENA